MKVVKKRCEKYGHAADYPPRVRKCRVRVGMLKTYCCWGRLVVEKKQPKRYKRMLDIGEKAICENGHRTNSYFGPCLVVVPDGSGGSKSCHGGFYALTPKAPSTLNAEAEVKKSRRPQDVAAEKLADIRARLKEKRTARRRLETSIVDLERKADRYWTIATMTDAEVENKRAKRVMKKWLRKRKAARRAIKFDGVKT